MSRRTRHHFRTEVTGRVGEAGKSMAQHAWLDREVATVKGTREKTGKVKMKLEISRAASLEARRGCAETRQGGAKCKPISGGFTGGWARGRHLRMRSVAGVRALMGMLPYTCWAVLRAHVAYLA